MIVKASLCNMFGVNPELVCDQLLYGWSVKAISVTERLAFVEAPMFYRGYAHLSNFTGKSYEADSIVTALCTGAYKEPTFKSEELFTLYMGSYVKTTAYEKDGFREIEGVNGESFYVHSKCIEKRRTEFDADKLIKTAKAFIGAPYKWGGKTCNGIDCSGFVAMCYHSCGIEIYRDSDPDKMPIGRRIGFDGLEKGDIVYLKGHVGLYVGKGVVVHASWREGKVCYTGLEEFLKLSEPVCAVRVSL